MKGYCLIRTTIFSIFSWINASLPEKFGPINILNFLSRGNNCIRINRYKSMSPFFISGVTILQIQLLNTRPNCSSLSTWGFVLQSPFFVSLRPWNTKIIVSIQKRPCAGRVNSIDIDIIFKAFFLLKLLFEKILLVT